jgi:DNA-binding XRE family transcriptional regulator
MTQQKLGEKADLNYKYLGAIERGEKNPTIDIVAKIASALDIHLHELFLFEHEIDDPKILKKKVDNLLEDASKREYKMVCRVIEAILK